MRETPKHRIGSDAFWLKWWVAFIISASVILLATLPPFLPADWRGLLMFSFSNICHQIPERSPHLDGIALAVCHRCYGVYLGLPLAMLGFLVLSRLPARTTKLRFIVLTTIVLMAVDWGAPLIGLWHNTAHSRMITGLLFGLSAGYYLVHVIAEQGKRTGTESSSGDDVSEMVGQRT